MTIAPFGVATVPGKYSASAAAWVERIAEACAETITVEGVGEVPVDATVLTETTNRRLPDEACPEGWKWLREWEPWGASNASILVRRDRFKVHESGAYVALLSDDELWTAKGKRRPPYYALVSPLIDKRDGHTMLLAAAHDPLPNTERRKAAQAEALANTPAVWLPGRAALGDAAVRLLVKDWNQNAVRSTVAEAWKAMFPGFTPSWVEGLPKWRDLRDWQAGGKGLVHLETEWHQRPRKDPFDHPWSVTAWDYRVPAPVVVPPVPPVEPHPVSHACPLEWCGALHTIPPKG